MQSKKEKVPLSDAAKIMYYLKSKHDANVKNKKSPPSKTKSK